MSAATPATPAEALRWYADSPECGMSPEGRAWSANLRRWADDLDAARSTDPGPAANDGETVESLTEAAGWIRDERDQAEDALAEVLRLLDRLDESGQEYDTDLIRGVIPPVLARRVLLANAPEDPGPAPDALPVDRSGYEVTVVAAENIDRADSGRRVDAKVLAGTAVSLAYELAALACDYHLVAAKQAIADWQERAPLSSVPPEAGQ